MGYEYVLRLIKVTLLNLFSSKHFVVEAYPSTQPLVLSLPKGRDDGMVLGLANSLLKCLFYCDRRHHFRVFPVLSLSSLMLEIPRVLLLQLIPMR